MHAPQCCRTCESVSEIVTEIINPSGTRKLQSSDSRAHRDLEIKAAVFPAHHVLYIQYTEVFVA